MERVVIYGAGGFGRELVRHVRNSRPGAEIVFVSDNPEEVGSRVKGLPVVGAESIAPTDLIVLAIADGAIRRELASRFSNFLPLHSPTALVDDGVAFAEGSILCDYTVVTADARTRIGKHFHCNAYSHVGHDCLIGDFVTLGPKVSVNGNVHLGDDVYIGSGAQIRSGTSGKPIVIGAGAFIAMGAVVVKDVPPGIRVAGNPARPMAQALSSVAA